MANRVVKMLYPIKIDLFGRQKGMAKSSGSNKKIQNWVAARGGKEAWQKVMVGISWG